MAKGVDFGTAILVCARKNDEGKTISNSERNCFIAIDQEAAEALDLSNYNYIKETENKQEMVYIVGKDALKLSNLFAQNDTHGERKTSLRRPMSKMVINSRTDRKAVSMLKYMIQGLVGAPAYEDEVCVLSIPANPLSGDFNNIFHSNMCQSFIKELGYKNVYPINEALSVIYSTAPSTKGDDGEDLPMTGIGISWGGGGVNGCLSYKGAETISFSVAQGGDWIDEQVSTVCDKTSSEVTVYKERTSREGLLDLSNPLSDDDIINGLYIYYKFLIETVVKQFKAEFIKHGTQFTDPIEVVVSGGTSKPEGFEKLVEQVIEEVGWPFDISGVRRAKDPLTATAIGCLNAAISKEKKKNEK